MSRDPFEIRDTRRLMPESLWNWRSWQLEHPRPVPHGPARQSGPRDMINEAKINATRRFGPGELVLAHVHDGDDWSEHEMVVWLPPEGEFGR